MNITMLSLQTMNGLTIAAIYILLASGLTIVLGMQGIINAAHGFFYMLGAYIGFTLISRTGLGFWLCLPAAFAVCALLGAGLEASGIRTLTKWNRGHVHQVVLTLGFAIVGTEVVKFIWGTVPQSTSVPSILRGAMVIGPIVYPKYWLFVIAFSFSIMVGLWIFFNWTGLGILVRSIDTNREASETLGTNAPLLTTIVFGLGTGIAGVAGVLAGPILGVDPNMGFELLMVLFVVIILGGLGSLMGTIASGVLIGLIIAYGTMLLSGLAAKILVFGVMIVILIFRPSGLLGRGTAIE